MARDILAVQGGSVGVERVFSMARDVVPYRRSRLKSSTIRASMLVKSYEHEELRRELVNYDSEREAARLEEMATIEDYRGWADRQEQSDEDGYDCISDDDESQKKDTAWSFVDQDGRRAFGKEPRPILPDRGLVESQYARPPPDQGQDGGEQLPRSEESGDDFGIWDSAVNMYVGSDTEEGSQEEEPEIAARVSDLENNNEVDNIGVASMDPMGLQEEVCSEEDVHLEAPNSVPMVLRVARRRGRGDGTGIGVTTRKRAGTGGKAKKRSRLN
jgi:hypothetical protein